MVTNNKMIIVILLLMVFTLQVQAQSMFNVKANPVSISEQNSLNLNRQFKKYQIYQLDIPALFQYVEGKKGMILLHLEMGSLNTDIEFELNDLRSATCKHQLTTDTGKVDVPIQALHNYVGRMIDDGSEIRLNIYSNRMSAVIRKSNKVLYIQPASQLIPGSSQNDIIFYSEDDVISNNNHQCGTGKLLSDDFERTEKFIQPKIKELEKNTSRHPMDLGELIKEKKKSTTSNTTYSAMISSNAATCRKLEIFVDRDWETYNMYNETYVTPWCVTNKCGCDYDVTWSDIYDNLNNVEGLYTQWGIDFVVVFEHDWATSNDPFSNTNADDILNELGSWWNTHDTHIKRDICILYSGKDMDSSVVGKAWIGGFVGTPYMIVQSNDWTTNTWICGNTNLPNNYSTAAFTFLVGHELGHLFNCQHDAQGAPYIMAPLLGSANTWSPASISSITNMATVNSSGINKLATRWWFVTNSTSNPISVSAGEFKINGQAISTPASPIAIQGVDGVTALPGANLSTNSTGGITLKTGPCQ